MEFCSDRVHIGKKWSYVELQLQLSVSLLEWAPSRTSLESKEPLIIQILEEHLFLYS